MSLIVETGAGLADAESYASVADADAYHAGRGNAQWTALTTERKEQLLRMATEYMAVYAGSLSGVRQYSTQALDWPRLEAAGHGFAVPPSFVPPGVKNACAVLALSAAAGPLSGASGSTVRRIKIGPMEKEYQDGAAVSARHPAADALIVPFFDPLAGNPLMARLERN
jgi:hypothetical protein